MDEENYNKEKENDIDISENLTLSERETLNVISNSIKYCEDELQEFKKKEVLDDFLNEIDSDMKQEVEKDTQATLDEVGEWNIYPQDTVLSIRLKAQQYLDNNFNGIQIGSQEFENLIYQYVESDTMESQKKIDENLEFGALYLYMCIYNTYILNNQGSTVEAYSTYTNPEDIDNMSFSEIAYDDSKENFIDTKVPKILKEYIDTY